MTGRAADVMPTIRACRIPRQWDPRANGWRIPVQFVDDLIADLEDRLGGDAVQVVRL